MKSKEPTPEIFKIVYKLSRWKTKSERYFTVFNTQEAFDDFCYAFTSGHVNSNNVTIYNIYRYDRFADKWYSEFDSIKNIPEYATKSKKKINLIRQ